MSTNRENITWQNARGLWRNAFYPFTYVNEDSEDFDPEWDVEYSYDYLTNVSPEFLTADLAYDSNTRHMSNPGGTNQVWYAGNELQVQRLEDLAHEYFKRRAAAALKAGAR